MNDLRRELAPITQEAWEAIEDEAKRTLRNFLAARRLVDFSGPHGWEHSAVSAGRARKLDTAPGAGGGVEARLRVVQPLVELRRDFTLSREELDNASRGADDLELDALVEAARSLAFDEDQIVFEGYDAAGIQGMLPASPHPPLPLGDDVSSYPQVVAEALDTLRSAGVPEPYRLALCPTAYTTLERGAERGYPVMQRVKRLVSEPVVRAPTLEGGGVLMSGQGGDFELTIGRDIALGYSRHDAESVTLYFEESLAFRVLSPEAAVRITG